MGKPRHVKQTRIRNDNSRSSISIYRELSSSRAIEPHDNSKNDNYKQRNRYNKCLPTIGTLVLSLLSPTVSLAADVGGVSATANPIANSSGSVTNQAIQVLQGPYITNTYGGGIQCQGATMNITPFITGNGAFKRPFERYYDDPVYDIHDADDDGQIDNPGNVLYYVPTRTNQTENYNLSVGVSATWSKPLDKTLQELCKTAATTQTALNAQLLSNKRLDFEIARLKNCGELMKAGIMFHPKSPYFKVCADVVLVNPAGVVAPHAHSFNSVSSSSSVPESPESVPVEVPSVDDEKVSLSSPSPGLFGWLRWPSLSQDEKPSGADQLGVLQVGHFPSPQSQSQPSSKQSEE
jgi:hypothetical protein